MIATWAFVAAGVASWYAAPGYNSAGHTCAMYLVPRGTIVRIVNANNHKSSWCKVTDYGPDAQRFPDRIIDVMPIVAKELGFYRLGIAHVRVYRERTTHESPTSGRTSGLHCFCEPAAYPLACDCPYLGPEVRSRTRTREGTRRFNRLIHRLYAPFVERQRNSCATRAGKLQPI